MNNRNLLILFLLFVAVTNALPKSANKTTDKAFLSDAEKRRFFYYFDEGVRLRNDAKYDNALAAFQFCKTINPNDAGLQSELAMLYGAIGMKNETVEAMEKAVELEPTNWWYCSRLIGLYTEVNEIDKALRLSIDLQKRFPSKEEVFELQASLYKSTGKFAKAIAAYDMLENLVGLNEAISSDKIQLYLLINKPKKSLAEIDRLIAKYPTEGRYKVLRGNFFMQQKQPELAYEAYQKILKEDPQNAYVYVSLSEYYKAKEDPDKALECIVNALKNESLDVDTKMQVLGQYVEKLVRDSTKLKETEGLFKLLIERYPLEEQAHGYYAAFLQYQKRIPETISELETMININPKNEQTWLQLIHLQLVEKKFDKIVQIAADAAVKLPLVPTWDFYKGIALYQLNDYPKSLQAYQHSLTLVTPERAALKEDLYAQIADTYYKMGNRDSAFAAYEKVLTINPRNIMAMNNYAYYLSLEKKELKRAERMSGKTVELEPNNSTYLDTYAWILYQQGNYSLAKFYIEKAVDNLPKTDDPGVVLEHYGDILWMSGAEFEAKALEVWQKSYDSGNKTEELKLKITNKGWKREQSQPTNQ